MKEEIRRCLREAEIALKVEICTAMGKSAVLLGEYSKQVRAGVEIYRNMGTVVEWLE